MHETQLNTLHNSSRHIFNTSHVNQRSKKGVKELGNAKESEKLTKLHNQDIPPPARGKHHEHGMLQDNLDLLLQPTTACPRGKCHGHGAF